MVGVRLQAMPAHRKDAWSPSPHIMEPPLDNFSGYRCEVRTAVRLSIS
jgi:hypothetical protein